MSGPLSRIWTNEADQILSQLWAGEDVKVLMLDGKHIAERRGNLCQ